MKYFVIGALTLAIIMCFFAITSHAQDSLSGQLKVNFQDETSSYTETYDFSDEHETKTSAHVEKSGCLKCLDYYHITDCQAKGECLDITVN